MTPIPYVGRPLIIFFERGVKQKINAKIFLQKALITTDGRDVKVSASSRFNPDFELDQSTKFEENGKILVKIFVGKSSYVTMEISKKRVS